MKSIVAVNTEIPGLKDHYPFKSGGSLADHDIILFDPTLPRYHRQHYSDGSSSIDRVSGREAVTHLTHWCQEIREALRDGKTVFFLLAEQEFDTYVTGVESSTSKVTNYTSSALTNYSSAPFNISITNSKGSKFTVRDPRFNVLFDTLKEHISYEAIIDEDIKAPIVTTIRGTKALGAIYKMKEIEASGHLVALPRFDLSDLTEFDDDEEEIWTKQALGIGTKLIKHLKDIDKFLTAQSEKTPPPEWVSSAPKSQHVKDLETKVVDLHKKIQVFTKQKDTALASIANANLTQDLLFETGKPLESAIEQFIRSIGYTVSNFRDGALEIDHLIVSPEGKRFVGEAEGKDTAAVNITKFRQLESNIGEDYEREEVTEHAIGILFGNGFRLTEPSARPEQFTDKCITNAKRLNTILVKTSDLYPAAVYLQDHSNDEEFKAECRRALESAAGSIAQMPPIPGAE
ncbi:hypothetical protein H7J86_01595 [Mycobacterium hackensackense]|uniref:hypothetical protein n=1 Tax=Mycobacterium hackensackense TaxID=228909 RepID=UPI002265F650|nr:hypothetical protein [Mycobacterium hackensackense]MCV7250849.1 hypothetical protein [Mycobacterium hackensackense]